MSKKSRKGTARRSIRVAAAIAVGAGLTLAMAAPASADTGTDLAPYVSLL